MSCLFLARFHAIALINKAGKKIKITAENTVTVVYQIQLAGSDNVLAYTPLKEAWSDSVYYFSTLSFKRSGHYTISFFVEGAAGIGPLVYSVLVEAKHVLCGVDAALEKLVAVRYLDHGNRQFEYRKKDILKCLNTFSF